MENIRAAQEGEADLVVFPELSLAGDITGAFVPDVALSLDSEALGAIAAASKDIDIVAGFVERGRAHRNRRYNSAAYFSGGKLLHRQRKLFLVNYAIFEEGKHYFPGDRLETFDTRLGRTCLLVCNDLWHTPIPYLAAVDGAELLLVPSNSARGALKGYLDIPETWENLNRVVSATMGFYTVFVNRAGQRSDAHGEFQYWGGSEVIDPRGHPVMKAAYDVVNLSFADVDLARVERQRYSAPIIRDSRLGLLRREIERIASEQAAVESMTDEDLESLGIEPGGGRDVRLE